MKVMVFVKANPGYEAGQMPSTELLTQMGKYNEELVKAGIMLAGDEIQQSVTPSNMLSLNLTRQSQ